MSNNLKIFFTKIFLFLLPLLVTAQNQHLPETFEDRLLEANSAFDAENWSSARVGYEVLYENGFYSERMLYRLAWMYEQDQNYPYAIYYLKKAERDFGGPPLIEDKIKQLLLIQGSSRFFSKDPIGALRKKVGWLFLALFAVCIGWYLFHLLYKPRQVPIWRKNINWLVHLFFVPLCILIFWQVFLPAKEGVIIQPTSYYAGPGYGAHPLSEAFSAGETVKITGQEDIWYKISVGSANYWVPKFTVKLL